MDGAKEVKEVNQWEEIARYKKAIVELTNEVLTCVPAIALQPIVAALDTELVAVVNATMAQVTASLEEKSDV